MTATLHLTSCNPSLFISDQRCTIFLLEEYSYTQVTKCLMQSYGNKHITDSGYFHLFFKYCTRMDSFFMKRVFYTFILLPFFIVSPMYLLQFADRQRFFIASDLDLLLDIFKTELNFLQCTWKNMLGRPIVTLEINQSFLGSHMPLQPAWCHHPESYRIIIDPQYRMYLYLYFFSFILAVKSFTIWIWIANPWDYLWDHL